MNDHVGLVVQVPVWANAVVALCVALLVGSVIANFILSRDQREPSARRPCAVATASMSAYFVAFAVLISSGLGAVTVAPPVREAALLIGLALVVLGTIVNLLGRLALGRNWANEATIWAEQRLVTRGVYRYIRHPLYASLIWLGVGIALIHVNILALAAMLFVFQPAMLRRANLEEEMLQARFPQYEEYRRRTGRFLPKLWQDQEGHG